MNRFLYVALTLVFGLVSACRPTPTNVAGLSSSEHAHGPDTPGLFLYEVKRDGRTSWLLGTIHVGFGFDEVLTEGARERFARASTVVVETDVTEADPTRLMNAALLPKDTSLRALLGDDAFKRLAARLDKMIPEPMLDRLAPWMPATILGLSDIQEALDEERPQGSGHMMDAELLEAARARRLDLSFLETVDEQISIFESIPRAEQVAELMRSLDQVDQPAGRALVEAFARGDEAGLERALFDEEQLKEAPGFYEAVLFARNRRWLERLEEHFARGDAFVAVGAAHLLGERGIIMALHERGYKISRVRH